MPYCFNDNKSKANFNVKSYNQYNRSINARGSIELLLNIPVSDGLPLGITTAYSKVQNTTTKGSIMVTGFDIVRYNTPAFHQIKIYLYNSSSLNVTFDFNLSLCMVG